MKTDFWGHVVGVGDKVTYIDKHYQSLCHGSITKLGEKRVTIRTDEYEGSKFFQDRMGYGKTCRGYECIVKEEWIPRKMGGGH